MSAAGRFDWGAARARLDEARRAFERALEPDPARVRRTLRERAKILAAPVAAEAPVESIVVVTFVLAGHVYAIESSLVREVCRWGEVTPVPCTPRFVAGIMNVRGEILSVIDLRPLLGLEAPEPGVETRVVFVESGPMRFGIVADAVRGAGSIALDAIHPPGGGSAAWVRGVTEEATVVLDGARLIGDETIVVRDFPAATAEAGRPTVRQEGVEE